MSAVMSSTSFNYAINGISSTRENLYLNEKFSDFNFICKSADGLDEIIPVHKSFLASVSDVFDVMFSDTWKGNVAVVIPDATSAEFKEFLQFFYLRRATLTTDNIERVMYLGDKYNVSECMNACVKFLHRILTEDNICWGYSLAILYNQNDLKRFCELIIASKTRAVFSSVSFLECNEEALGHILKIDPLSCSEVEVFETCMEWVKRTSGAAELTREIIQTYLGDLIYEIRFKSMTLQQFATLIPSYGGLFSADDYREIILLISKSYSFERSRFSQNYRIPFESLQFCEMGRIECDRSFPNEFSRIPYYLQSIEKTTFTVNQPMLLHLIVCSQIAEYRNNDYYPIDSLSAKMKIVEITQYSPYNGKIVFYTEDIRLQSLNTSKIKLPTPILIRPGITYEIQMEQTPSPNCCTGTMLKTEVQMESDFTAQFYGDSIVGIDGVARGLIRYLEFYRI